MRDRIGELTIREDATLRAAMEAIDRGASEIALVVDDAGRLLGTITDGDVRRALLGGSGMDSPASGAMNRGFTAVPPRQNRAAILDLMRARSFHQIPVVDAEGRLVGLHLMQEIIGSVERPNWAVIMAGGRGRRLRPFTAALPKPMIEVAGRPILERIVLHMVGFGIRTIFLSVHYKAERIEEYFGDGGEFGCRIEYLREPRPLGTGGSLALLPESPADPVLVLNGDLLTGIDVDGLLRAHGSGGYAMTVATKTHQYEVPFGVVSARNGLLTRLTEKPVEQWLVNAGIYVVSPGVVDRVPAETHVHMTQLVEDCLGRGERVGVFEMSQPWLDVGRPRDLLEARGEESSR